MNLRRRQIVAASALAAAAAFFAGVAFRQYRRDDPPQDMASEAALAAVFAIQLDDFRGRTHAFAQWKGQILVVNFWAAWCAPCREEMPYFSRIATKRAGNGVQFVGISTDPPEVVKSFAQQYRIAYPLLVGGPGAIELSATLGNRLKGLPFTIVLGRNGEPLLTHTGRLAEAELENVLDRHN